VGAAVAYPLAGFLAGAALALAVRHAAVRRAFAAGTAAGRRALAAHAAVGGVVGLLLLAPLMWLVWVVGDVGSGGSPARDEWRGVRAVLAWAGGAGLAAGLLAGAGAMLVDRLYGDPPEPGSRLVRWPAVGAAVGVAYPPLVQGLVLLVFALTAAGSG